MSRPSPPSSLWIMADVEQQKIAVELRKFRKKLRQIEKLEELERDLTEEELLKVRDNQLPLPMLFRSSGNNYCPRR